MDRLSAQSISPGDALPERQLVCNTVQLFFYNAALWNAHRIHFDAPYAADVCEELGFIDYSEAGDEQ